MAESLSAYIKLKKREYTDHLDVAAMNAVLAGKASDALTKKALAILLKDHEHLVWRVAPRLRPGTVAGDELLRLAKKSKGISCRLYAAVAPAGGATLAAIHHGDRSNEEIVAALAKIPEAKSKALTSAAARIASEKTFPKVFAAIDTSADGVVALCMLAKGRGLDRLLADRKSITPYLNDLLAVATKAGATEVKRKLAAMLVEQSAKSESGRWAKALGLTTPPAWGVEINIRAREDEGGSYYPYVEIGIGGDDGCDWRVDIHHPEKGSSRSWDGETTDDDLGLPKLRGLDEVGVWMSKSQKKLGLEWATERAGVKTKLAGAKPKILAWVKRLGA
jgi:hypothetical protein